MTGDILTDDPAFGRPSDIRDYSRAILDAVPGAAVIVFDRDLRVRLVEGDALGRLGIQAHLLDGQVIPDVVLAGAWVQLKDAYSGALAGRPSTFDFTSWDSIYSIHVSPLTMAGGVQGAVAISHEVTEQRRLELAIGVQEAVARDTERLLATAFDRSSLGMSVTGLDGRWLRVNDAYCRMMGYEREALLELTFAELTHPDDLAVDLAWLRESTAGATSSLERDKRYVTRAGTILWAHVRADMIRDDEGRPLYAVSLLEDITGRRSSELALSASEQRLRSIVDNTPGAVSVQGRDHRYQLVNPAFEERFGLEPGWSVGRLVDEVLPPDVVRLDRESHERVIRTGRPAQHEEQARLDGEDRVQVSVKFPLRDEHGEIVAVCGMREDITERRRRELDVEARLQWTDRIHTAVTQDRLVLHAQPIVDLRTGRAVQAELLVRMFERAAPSTLIPPGEFLPAAERFDLVAVIDHWVVARALVLAREHPVAVNLSARTISDPQHVAEIERLLAASDAPPANLIFEITETAVLEHLASARSFAQRLRALGCSFALDDFGVGFGSFTYLKHLPADYLKIDVDFVRDILRDDTDRQVVQAMVGVARDFGIKTIAEGVEDQGTLDLLSEMGIDYAQGFHIGRPAPITELWPDRPTSGETR